MSLQLFNDEADEALQQEPLPSGATLLRQFTTPEDTALLTALDQIVARAPFRHMITPGGFRMAVAMTNCGTLGWVTDRSGYRYDGIDPVRAAGAGRKCRRVFSSSR